jgi:hypothetical protein
VRRAYDRDPVARREAYAGGDDDAPLIVAIGADGKKLEGVIEARPLWQELVFRLPPQERQPGAALTQTRKMPFTLVHAVTGEVIDDRGAAR